MVQVPQLIIPPHPLEAVPQFCPPGQVVAAVHPQWLVTPPPPQVFGDMHVPQLIVPPHPSGAVPQSCPLGQAVPAVHPH
jgi:hypothetical protein